MTIKTNALKSIAIAVTLSCGSMSLSATAHDTHAHENTASSKVLENAVSGDHRTAKNKARDQYRHPIETLNFFGFTPDMTVVEITPGGGWYTEILAPALKGTGKLYGAHYPDKGTDDYYPMCRWNS